MRLCHLTEARRIVDFRHKPVFDRLPYWPSRDDPKYIAAQDGFHFQYADGELFIYSTDNLNYSAAVHGNGRKDRYKLPWNRLGGLVDLTKKTITIAKDSFVDHQGRSRLRQRMISDLKELQKTLASMRPLGVTGEFQVKGVSGFPPTVKEILELRDPTDQVLTSKSLTMYHGTSPSRWEEIKRIGLQPGHTGEAYVDLIPGYSERNVYLSLTAKGAEYYGKRQSAKDGESGYVVLAVTVPDSARLIADDRFAHRQSAFPQGTDPKSLRLSGRLTGEFAYRGRIPPRFIRLLARRK